MLYPLVTPPLDDEGSQYLWWSVLLLTPPLGSQGQSLSLMVTPPTGHQSVGDSLSLEGGKGTEMQLRVLIRALLDSGQGCLIVGIGQPWLKLSC